MATLQLPEKPSNATEIGAMVGAAIRPHTQESHAPQTGKNRELLNCTAPRTRTRRPVST
ncbi:hypothetical protein SBA1_600047 [Candidatus Sulfotelmatobacter kueseliae]|uniref:Uncharacterized protein n=1 Tax=Candidatus Sulfotelmatobacter kueseliae TaxID=2042962 RepID=A0A2U3L1D7_9BACT|nr:hypothetical protein SBA1_600047 [Candidatus Sulfotelmatobacter kueseliae]